MPVRRMVLFTIIIASIAVVTYERPTVHSTDNHVSDADEGDMGMDLMEFLTALGIILALILALRESYKERKRDEKQKKAIRTLLRLEIESNLNELKPIFEWVRNTRDKQRNSEGDSAVWPPSYPKESEVILHNIKDGLESQLELYSKAISADEIVRVSIFYQGLHDIEEHRGRVKRSYKVSGAEDVVEAPVVERQVSRDEAKDLLSIPTLERILSVSTLGNELINSLSESTHPR
jgi:hypothetical protein